MCGPEAGQGLSWPWSECQEILVLPCWTLGALLSALPRSPAPLTVEFGSQDDTCAVLPPGGGMAQVCDGSVGPLVQFCQY